MSSFPCLVRTVTGAGEVRYSLTNDWLAGEYRRAAALIDADQTAVAAMVAVQEVTGR